MNTLCSGNSSVAIVAVANAVNCFLCCRLKSAIGCTVCVLCWPLNFIFIFLGIINNIIPCVIVIVSLLGCCPKQHAVSVLQCNTRAVLELREPSKPSLGNFRVVWVKLWRCLPLWSSSPLSSSLSVYPSSQWSSLSLSACFSPPPPLLHPSLFFMLAPWSGQPQLQKLPHSQAAPQPCPGIIISFAFDTLNLRQ